jgi:hypothetical protein
MPSSTGPLRPDTGSITSAAVELVAISDADAWFTYYYWLDDRVAPDYARTVDIHRKPGYDPAELFLDPALTLPQLRIGLTLARKKLGFRYLMEVIPLDASVVRGSHGRPTASLDDGPLFISSEAAAVAEPLEPRPCGIRCWRICSTSPVRGLPPKGGSHGGGSHGAGVSRPAQNAAGNRVNGKPITATGLQATAAPRLR